jgi:hypothetical protein
MIEAGRVVVEHKTSYKMLAPRLRAYTRLSKISSAQCLCQRAARRIPPLTAYDTVGQRRRQYSQYGESNKSTFQAAKELYKKYPFSVSLAFATYEPPDLESQFLANSILCAAYSSAQA